MEIYSPKSQKADNFKKNTLKNKDIMINSKAILNGRTIIFELNDEEQKKKSSKSNMVISMIDFLKLNFYNRMKLFFDYEDKIKESTKTLIK
jgi:hypothetical protein